MLPDSVTEIGEMAFEYCQSLETLSLPRELESLSFSAFSWCKKLESVAIPPKLKDILRGTFANCAGLKNLTLSEGVTFAESGAFNCNVFSGVEMALERVELPRSLTSLADDAFQLRKTFREFIVPADHPTFYLQDGGLFTRDGTLVLFREEKTGTCTIPESVRVIGPSAFLNMTGLEGVNFPAGLETISYGAFADCENLESVLIPASVTKLWDDAFKNSPKLVISATAAIEHAKQKKLRRRSF